MDRYRYATVGTLEHARNSQLWLLLLGGLLLALIFTATAQTAQAQESTLAGRGVLMPGAQRHTVADPNAFVYTVRLGEYWILIARKFGVTYDALRKANGDLWTLRGELIWPGDEMAIPGLTAADQRESLEYTVQPGDSWYRIAGTFGVSYWDLRLDNLGLWRRRGIVIRPGDQMQIVNPNPAAIEKPLVAESVAAAQPVAAQPAAPAATATAQPASTPAQAATPAPTAQPPAPGTLPTVTSGGTPFRVTNPPADAVIYSVRPGDSWFSIAGRYGMPFETLRSANQELWALRGQNIRPADEMMIPAHGSPPPPPEIKAVPDDKAETIPADSNYAVQEGDTWTTVAARSGVTEDALKAANVELAGRALAPGDVIRIP